MTDPPDRVAYLEQLGQAIAAVAAESRRMMNAYVRAMAEFWASPEGQYLKRVVDYYNEHPAELDAMIAAREFEAELQSQQHCHCLCGRWKHLGTCVTYATTQRRIGGAVVPLCGPCSASIDAQRTVAR